MRWNDIWASIIVAAVSVPMAVGIAHTTRASIYAGILAAVIGSGVVGFLSPSRFGVSGPSNALALIVFQAVAALGGFSLVSLAIGLAGIIQFLLGSFKFGRLTQYFPFSVIHGAFAGLGLMIILHQIPHATGWDIYEEAEEAGVQFSLGFNSSFSEALEALQNYQLSSVFLLGLSGLVFWILIRKSRFLAFFGVLGVGIFSQLFLNAYFPSLALSRADGHFVQIPQFEFASFLQGVPLTLQFDQIPLLEVLKYAVVIAFISSFESLLSLEALVKIDPEHKEASPHSELKAQGIGNIVSGILGGLPLSTVLSRSTLNFYSGAGSKLSTLLIFVWVILGGFLFGSFLNLIPLVSLAFLLIVIGVQLILSVPLRAALQKDLGYWAPFLTTVFVCVVTDLFRGISVGLFVAVALYLKNHAKKAVTVVSENGLYFLRINHDLSFFHRADLKEALESIPDDAKVHIDGSAARVIDQDLIELIRDFKEGAVLRRVTYSDKNVFNRQL